MEPRTAPSIAGAAFESGWKENGAAHFIPAPMLYSNLCPVSLLFTEIMVVYQKESTSGSSSMYQNPYRIKTLTESSRFENERVVALWKALYLKSVEKTFVGFFGVYTGTKYKVIMFF